MEDNSNSNQEEESEIKEGDLLNIANNILSLLNYSQKLDNEDDLFLDDFYVSIIGNLLSENQPEIIPGKTLEEKAEIMNSLVQSLSEAIEVDLSHINGGGIILNHDKVSAKNLLDVMFELISFMQSSNEAYGAFCVCKSASHEERTVYAVIFSPSENCAFSRSVKVQRFLSREIL